MKISIIGAGNVGSLAAMRIAEELSCEVVLVDIAKGIAEAKALDLEDARAIRKVNYTLRGTEDIKEIRNSDIIVLSAGLTRKPGMLREELLAKNSDIVKSICVHIRDLAKEAVIIIVTNPLDLMTYVATKNLGFEAKRVFGMGLVLDSSRFANLIAQELSLPVTDIEAVVIGSHGEGMIPLPRLTTIKGLPLDNFIDAEKINGLIKRTMARGQEIVSLLANASAFFAPSAAVASLVRAVAKNEKRILGVSVNLNGEYGIKDVSIGVPCRIGKDGIEQIVELELSQREKESLLKSAAMLKEQLVKLQCQ